MSKSHYAKTVSGDYLVPFTDIIERNGSKEEVGGGLAFVRGTASRPIITMLVTRAEGIENISNEIEEVIRNERTRTARDIYQILDYYEESGFLSQSTLRDTHDFEERSRQGRDVEEKHLQKNDRNAEDHGRTSKGSGTSNQREVQHSGRDGGNKSKDLTAHQVDVNLREAQTETERALRLQNQILRNELKRKGGRMKNPRSKKNGGFFKL